MTDSPSNREELLADNPLLRMEFRIPFDQIRAVDVEPAIGRLLQDTKARVDSIAAVSTPRTYDNTLEDLEKATEQLEYASGIVRHLESVATTAGAARRPQRGRT